MRSVLDTLGKDELRLLLLLPGDGTSLTEPDGTGDIVRRLADKEVEDPSGLVSFRVQLVEAGPDGLRLSRLGRAVAAAVRMGH